MFLSYTDIYRIGEGCSMINLLHMKYAVEVAQTGSINRAAEKLLIGQPNLSRAVKELEASLNIQIFDRSAKGMTLTPEGEIFMNYAKSILKQVDAVEEAFAQGYSVRKRFSISVPRASYICEAFSDFAARLDREREIELFYKETNASRAITNILQEDYRLGIIRYAESYDRYYKSMLEEKNLNYEMIAAFRFVLVMNQSCPLAQKDDICYDDLADYTEIAHADPYVPSLPASEVKKEELPDNIHKRIFVFERASQFDLLSKNPNTFMWVSPVPARLLERFGLVQRTCAENRRVYKDILIRRKGYTLTKLDHMFIEELIRTKREVFQKEDL